MNGGRLSLRGALFRTDKENAREASPTNSALYVLAGNQRVDGVEFEVQGHLTDRWELLSSYTFMHSEVVKSQFYPHPWAHSWPMCRTISSISGPSTACLAALRSGAAETLWIAERQVPRCRTIPRPGCPRPCPSYWVANAMAKYEITERISVQANVFNLLDRNYIDQIHPGHLVPGAGTSALFGLKFKF